MIEISPIFIYRIMEAKKILSVVADEKGSNTIISRYPGLDDQVILEAMAAVGEDEGKARTATDRINGLVAGRILDLGIKSGAELVFPVGSVVKRNIKERSPVGETEDPLEGTLFALYRSLMTSQGPIKLDLALQLGDRGLHLSSGFNGNRHLPRVMSEQEIARYAMAMALAGYNSALDVARSHRTTDAMVVKSVIPPLVRRYREVVKIMSAIREQMQGPKSLGMELN